MAANPDGNCSVAVAVKTVYNPSTGGFGAFPGGLYMKQVHRPMTMTVTTSPCELEAATAAGLCRPAIADALSACPKPDVVHHIQQLLGRHTDELVQKGLFTASCTAMLLWH